MPSGSHAPLADEGGDIVVAESGADGEGHRFRGDRGQSRSKRELRDGDPRLAGHRVEQIDPAALFVDSRVVYRPRVLGQWCDGIRIYAAASSPTRSRRT